MKTNFRRNVSAALILTPAALLAACSTSDSWHSSRADTDTRADSTYNGKSRNDGYYSSSDRRYSDRAYTTSDGRTVYYDRRATGYDPYGDGVAGGPGTRVTTLNDGSSAPYATRTNERNNPNWRDGPTRYDNDNPSQDNASSQYNTGVTRNQSPADGTVNNQNLAKGTVRPEGQSQYRDGDRMTRIDNTDTRWQNEQRMAHQNDPNWREGSNGPSRYDNQNPSQDNSSSQYNTGIARNQSPNEGTVNNQNIAKGTVPVNSNDSRWQQQNDPNWQARNQQQWDSRQQAARNESDASTNPSNSNVQQGQQNWQANQSAQQNQNWANRNQNSPQYSNNQQLPPRERDQNGNWIERNFNTTNMTTPEQQAAARQMSDPATNPTNSNSQYNQGGQSNNGQYTAQNNQDYSTRTYPVNSNSTASTNGAPSNGVEPLGPQNNWGANRTSSTASSNNTSSNSTYYTNNTNRTVAQDGTATRTNNVLSPSSSQTAAARDISDPSTNPSNSNAQIGQQNLAGVSQPGSVVTADPAVSKQPYSSRPADLNAAGQPTLFAANATADSRILSLIHMKNQEEIELGRLAASNGSSAAVRDYGNMLVREHSSADAKVLAVASQTGTTLLSDAETKNMVRAEKAAMKDHSSMDGSKEKMADDSKIMRDPIEELRSLNGADFDRTFSQKMVKGHEKLAAAIEKAKPQVKNEQTRQLLNELLPTVQMHEKMARQLPGYTETASVR